MILLFFIFLTSSVVNASELIEIRTADELRAIDNNLSGNYILMNDIDLSETRQGGQLDSGNGWKPIGDLFNSFSGVFDGNGYKIKNVNIYGEFSVEYTSREKLTQGLFGSVSGTIKNLGLVNINYNIDAFNTDGYIDDVGPRLGGLVGCLGGQSSSVIDNCYVTGSINYNVPCVGMAGFGEVGGLAGRVYEGEIRNCFTNVIITSTGRYTAGIAVEGTLNNSYSLGKVTGIGLGSYDELGQCSCMGYCDNVYYLYSNGDDIKGIPMTDYQMKNQNYYKNFDFASTWIVDPYCSYPYPQLQNNRIVRIVSTKLIPPSKTQYVQGEQWDLSGGVLNVVYEDGVSASIPLKEDMLSGYNMDKIGSQTVTVSYGKETQSFDIDVKEIPVESVNIPQTINIFTAQLTQLTAVVLPENASDKTIKWTTSDPNIAFVDDVGNVMGRTVGRVTISATSVNGKTATCTVSVMVRCVALSSDTDSYELNVGDVKKINITRQPINSTEDIKWKSSNTSVANVMNGEIYAISEGEAIITAYTDNAVEVSINVTVKDISKIIKELKSNKLKITSIKNIKGKKIKLSVYSKVNCDGYEIQYSLKKIFQGKKIIKKCSKTAIISKLKKGKTYYVRARIYKNISGIECYGKWSAVKKIKLKK